MQQTAQEWISGNDLELLENGEEYFPALFTAVDEARSEILLETYIWNEDEIGAELTERLTDAARRGVSVKITIDGFGSPSFPESYLAAMTAAGIAVCAFDSQPPALLNIQTNVFCRMHRKIAVIDRTIAFVGGINVWALHLRRYGHDSMQDYAVEVRGPIVARIHEAVRDGVGEQAPSRLRRWRKRIRAGARHRPAAGRGARAAFVMRDNRDHPNDIELMYRRAIREAKREIWIACAYFFPGYRLLRDLTRAARRGVEVRLVLQGRPDVAISTKAASILYDNLMGAGVRVFHYMERAMHGKVAVIDASWSTVGSSNLDPISLGLNLEANVFAVDRQFAAALRASLEKMMAASCEEVTAEVPRRGIWQRLLLLALYHLTRRMPRWGALVLRRPQTTKALRSAADSRQAS